MIYRFPWLLSLALALGAAISLGCPGGSLLVTDDDDVQGDDDATGDDDDAQGDDDDAQGDDDDTGSADDDDTQGDDDDSPYAGEYEGQIQLSVDSPQGPMVFQGPLLALVSALGVVTCSGEVDAPMEVVLVDITGEVTDAGVFIGEAYQAPANMPQQGPFETDGEFTPGGFELSWSGSVPTPDGQEMLFEGTAEGWPI